MDGVIFDLDGTLLDSMGLWRKAGCIYLEKFGIKADESLADIILPLTISGAAVYIKQNFSIPLPVGQIKDGINAVMEEGYKNYIPAKEGASKLLAGLYAHKIPMALATATDRYLVESAFRRFGWEKYFTGIFTCSEVGVGKRDGADVYLAAMKSFCGTVKGSWVFEDSPHAAKTAYNAGFNVAGVKDEGGKGKQEELKKFSTVYFESLSPAEKVLKTLGAE